MKLHDPNWLWFLLLLPFLAWSLQRRLARTPALRLGHAGLYDSLPDTARARVARLLPWLRLLVIALALLALARPQELAREAGVKSRGVDLMLTLDLSTSMLAEDARAEPPRINRLNMAQAVIKDFLAGRPGDRIGLMAFAARPYPASPLTLDHAWLQATVARLKAGDIEDGTALGDALLAALNRLRGKAPDQRRHQAVILVTDGRSNAGATPPELAAAAAASLGIRVHAIGIGAAGPAVIPIENPLGGILYRRVRADLDEATLQAVAARTGGRYFRADDPAMLARVFREIDQLEKAPIEEKARNIWREWFAIPLLAAFCLFFLEALLRASWLRRLP
jgi:Ca-activated chloride channel family protein